MGARRHLALATAATIVLPVLSASIILAQEESLGGKLRAGDAVTVPAGQTVAGDLYAFAGTVTVDGTIEGDLIAAAGQVVLNGQLNGDLLAAGGAVTVAGSIAGDARLAGGQLRIDGDVAEDVLAMGGQIVVGSRGRVGQDVIASGGQIAIDGAVEGSVTGSAGAYSRSGTVGGVEDVAITERAPEVAEPANRVLDAIRHYLVVLLFGALGLWLAPRAMTAVETVVRRRPLPAFGWGAIGIAAFVVILIAATILTFLLAIAFGSLGFESLVALDVGGGFVALAAISLAFWFVAAFIADAIVGLALGRLAAPEEVEPRWRPFAVLAVGAGVVVLLTSLPVVGSWLKLLVVVLGLGALLAAAYGSWRRPATAEG